MKRYWVFGGLEYYASGGMSELIATFDDEMVAVEFAKSKMQSDKINIEWVQVVDVAETKLVMSDGHCYGSNMGVK